MLKLAIATVIFLCPLLAHAESLCFDLEQFQEDGWHQPEVQAAMDDYLRQHRMRVNWLREPVPPDQIGKDYYEWLWHSGFGARMKQELMLRFCGAVSENNVG